MIVYLDTHCLVWLFYGEREKFSAAAHKAIEENDLIASPMSVLEMQLLHEIGRMKQTASTIMTALEADIGLQTSGLLFREVAAYAVMESWTRDPFDRLIVATAKAAGAPLISKNDRIRRHYREAIW